MNLKFWIAKYDGTRSEAIELRDGDIVSSKTDYLITTKYGGTEFDGYFRVGNYWEGQTYAEVKRQDSDYGTGKYKFIRALKDFPDAIYEEYLEDLSYEIT